MLLARSTMMAMIASSATVAQAEPGPVRLALNIGSLGAGPEIGFRPSRWVSIRGSFSLAAAKHHRDIGDIRYGGRLRLRNYAVMGDVHPLGNGWRLSAWLGGNGNRVRLKAMPMAPVTVGARTYTPAEIGTLRGEITTRDYAPIVTVGYGGPLARHFTVSGDAGVMFHGRPRMGPLTSTTTLIAAADLAIERDRIQRDIRKYRLYPVLQLSLGYRF